MGIATSRRVQNELSAPRVPKFPPSLAALFGVLWVALLAGGIAVMHRYDNTPGSAGHASTGWPAASRIQRTPGQATLVVVAHPKCPCTRATLEELTALMTESAGKVTAHVLFFKPANAGDEWAQTALWRAAAAIPGVTVSCDEGGLEAKRFGGETSGDVFLYEAGGRLAFHGGITAARGEAGSNAGHTALAALLGGNQPRQARTAVFGCPVAASATNRLLNP